MKNSHSTLIRLAVTTALASTALAGCSNAVAPSAAHSVGEAEVALAKGKASKAVNHAEQAVLADPRDAYARTLLGNAYLEAGRFASAAQSFEDAIALGDTSPRTVISHSLALTGMGDRAKAIYVLESHESAIDPADFGLAIALAGQPQRGVHVLSNTLRAGNNTAKVRQNLAYAYAMSGQWREARIMVSEDVPADQVGDRMAEWGAIAHPDQYRTRIASLLKVDIVNDPGQPAMLALGNNPTVDMLASETSAESGTVTDFAYDDAGELPSVERAPIERVALDEAEDARSYDAPQPALVAAIKPDPASRAALTQPGVDAKPKASVAQAFADTSKASSASVPAPKTETSRFAMAKGNYNIQLGSYFSQADAERGWQKMQRMYPSLAGAERIITKARVNGKIYYRVAAVGFARDSARAVCSTVKGKGGGCIAYADSNPLPGAILDHGKVRVAAR